jgi:hypothetical protein
MRAGLSAGEVAGWAQASDGLIAGFYLVDRGVVAPAAGNLELRPVWWSLSRSSVGSDTNGHTTVVSLRGGPQGVGSIGIVPIGHVAN